MPTIKLKGEEIASDDSETGIVIDGNIVHKYHFQKAGHDIAHHFSHDGWEAHVEVNEEGDRRLIVSRAISAPAIFDTTKVSHFDEDIDDMLREALHMFLNGFDPLAHFSPDFVIRCTDFSHMMGFCGEMFSGRIENHRLENITGCHRDQYDEKGFNITAQPLPKEKNYDYFISYRWSAGQSPLFNALCCAFNLKAALVITMVTMPIIALLLSLVPDPCDSIFTIFTVNCGSTGHLFGQEHAGQWYIFPIIGVVVLFCAVLFYAQVCRRGEKVFIDRTCINQIDREYMRMGVAAIPTILVETNCFVCLYDYDYLTRLWCAYELSIYSRLNPNPNFKFVNVQQAFMWLMMIIWVNGIFTFFPFNKLWQNNAVSPDVEYVLNNVYAVLKYFVVWALCKRFLDSVEHLGKMSTEFDVRKCEVSEVADKPILLFCIGRIFNYKLMNYGLTGEGEPSIEQWIPLVNDGIHEFNLFVRGMLRKHYEDQNRVVALWPYEVLVTMFLSLWFHHFNRGFFFYPFWSEHNHFWLYNHNQSYLSMYQYYVSAFTLFVYNPLINQGVSSIIHAYILIKFYHFTRTFRIGFYLAGFLYGLIAIHWQALVHDFTRLGTGALISGHDGEHAVYEFKPFLPYLTKPVGVSFDLGSLELNLFVGWCSVLLHCYVVYWVYEPEWIGRLFKTNTKDKEL